MRFVWLILGLISFSLGVIGAFLPLLPTVPFMLLAAFLFSKSSERLHNWLITHPVFGPSISDWQQNGAITRRIKLYSTVSIVATFGLSLAFGLKPIILIIQGITLLCVSVFIWTRPEA